MAERTHTTSFIDMLRQQVTVSLEEQETQRILLLESRPVLAEQLEELCHAIDIEVVCLASHHELPFSLHHHRPIAVVCVIEPALPGSITALRSIAAHDQDLPVMVVTGDDPISLGTIDAAERLWGLTGLHCVPQVPNAQDVVGFLFQAGRRSNTGRLLPIY